ncbi:MAG: LCP family protein [Anaeromicrobium sp.]|uniref:LCP family protein n=1 Tax=Anaeromicrobium sp. TaxID=1929132 RepID=UPI0025FB0F1E|nr:LCP family protein [Anaeromicrobium sp.]MCT4594856.1 LCP family protein [Anaeromicrobium sp.]
MKKFFKVFIIAFFCFLLVMGSGTYIFLNSIEQKEFATENTEVDSREVSEKRKINILAVGVDAKNLKNSKTARTDTMMLASIDTDTKEISVISIPRDSRVLIRGRSKKDKINHAHVYGGIDLTKKAVKDLLGVPIDYYVKINYEGLGKVVDTLGGVEVDVPQSMKYYDPYADPPLRINIKKGKQVLNGDKAMQFVRFRKGYKNQDLGRIQAQQMFINAVIKKVKSPSIIVKLPRLIKNFNSYVDTDMPLSTMTYLAIMAKDFDLSSIQMTTIPGDVKTINSISYFIPDLDGVKELVNRLVYNR